MKKQTFMKKWVVKKNIRNIVRNINAFCFILYLIVSLCYIFILACFFGIVYAAEYYRPLFVCGIILIAMLILHEYIGTQRSKKEAEKQNVLLIEQYTALEEMYQANGKLYHDFHNHMNVLYHLIGREDFEEAKSYIEKISEPVREISEFSLTGNDIVDIVINSKRKRMDQNGIGVMVNAEFPAGMSIDVHDICIILSNLLDNAIEGAVNSLICSSKVQRPEIKIVIRRIHGFLFLKVVNSCEKKLNGGLYSTKTRNGMHGFGLRNIKEIVEKYDGSFQVRYCDNLFEALVMIPNQNPPF